MDPIFKTLSLEQCWDEAGQLWCLREKWNGKGTFKINSSPSHRTLYSGSCRMDMRTILHGPAKGLGIKTHKGVYMVSFLIQGLLSVK